MNWPLTNPLAIRLAALAATYAGMEPDGIPPGDVGRLIRDMHDIAQEMQREADAVLVRMPEWFGIGSGHEKAADP